MTLVIGCSLRFFCFLRVIILFWNEFYREVCEGYIGGVVRVSKKRVFLGLGG